MTYGLDNKYEKSTAQSVPEGAYKKRALGSALDSALGLALPH